MAGVTLEISKQLEAINSKIENSKSSFLASELDSTIKRVNPNHHRELLTLGNGNDIDITSWLPADEFPQEIQKEHEIIPIERAETIQKITTLKKKTRWNLYRLWIKLYNESLEAEMTAQRNELANENQRCKEQMNEIEVEITKGTKIIGMTTTGAAKNRHIIDSLKPKITSKINNFVFLPSKFTYKIPHLQVKFQNQSFTILAMFFFLTFFCSYV